MQILQDKQTWMEVANILAEIQNGTEAKYEELHGVERAFIEQETNRILTVIALKVFPKYLEKVEQSTYLKAANGVLDIIEQTDWILDSKANMFGRLNKLLNSLSGISSDKKE